MVSILLVRLDEFVGRNVFYTVFYSVLGGEQDGYFMWMTKLVPQTVPYVNYVFECGIAGC